MRLRYPRSVGRAFLLRFAAALAIPPAMAACAIGSTSREDADAVRAHDRKVCTDYGFRIGAEDFAHCIQALHDQRARSAR